MEIQSNAHQKNGYIASIGPTWNTGFKPTKSVISTLCYTQDHPKNIAVETKAGERLDQNKANWTFVGGAGRSTNSAFFYPGTDQSDIFTLSGYAGANYVQSPTFSVKQGEKYILNMLVKENGSGTSGLNLEIYAFDGNGSAMSGWSPSWPLVGSTEWTYVSRVIEFNNTGSGAYIRVGADDNEQFYVDRISLIPYFENYAMTSEGLYGQQMQYYGLLTGKPVAPGADMLGWSGWSTTDYLRIEPSYLTDAVDVTFMFWYKGNSGHIFGMYDKGTGDNCRVEFISNKLRWVWTDNVGTASTVECLDPDVSNAGRWHHAVCIKNGGHMMLYKDGRLVNVNSNSNFEGTGTAAREIVIGARPDNYGENFNGEISMFRMAKSANLTDAQVMKIYQEERKLFQRNAKCSLGMSGRVIGGWYDEQTETSHVITSTGRSSFQGLTRFDHVERKTDSGLTDVCAVNGLVVET